jgi:hypothetical protein
MKEEEMGRLIACMKEIRNVHNFWFGHLTKKEYVRDFGKNGITM